MMHVTSQRSACKYCSLSSPFLISAVLVIYLPCDRIFNSLFHCHPEPSQKDPICLSINDICTSRRSAPSEVSMMRMRTRSVSYCFKYVNTCSSGCVQFRHASDSPGELATRYSKYLLRPWNPYEVMRKAQMRMIRDVLACTFIRTLIPSLSEHIHCVQVKVLANAKIFVCKVRARGSHRSSVQCLLRLTSRNALLITI